MAFKIKAKILIQLIFLLGMPFFIACSHSTENIKEVDSFEIIGQAYKTQHQEIKLEATRGTASDSTSEETLLSRRLEKFNSELASSDIFNSSTCESFLSERNESVFPKKVIEIQNAMADQAEPKEEIVESLRRSSQRTRSLITIYLTSNSKLSNSCKDQLKVTVRKLRSLEDYFREIAQKFEHQHVSAVSSIFENNQLEISSFQNPLKYEFTAGDIILARDFDISNLYQSKQIDPYTEFNRAALVVQNSKSKLFVLESSAARGLKLSSIKEWDSRQLARILVLRPSDYPLSQALSRSVFANLTNSHGKLKPSKSFEIIELVKFALELSGAGRSVAMEISDFTDLEVNPALVPVYESRNTAALRMIRIESSSLQSMFDWQQSRSYRFESTGKVGSDKKQFELVLHAIETELQKREALIALEQDLPMLPADLAVEAEAFRKSDCEAYKTANLAKPESLNKDLSNKRLPSSVRVDDAKELIQWHQLFKASNNLCR